MDFTDKFVLDFDGFIVAVLVVLLVVVVVDVVFDLLDLLLLVGIVSVDLIGDSDEVPLGGAAITFSNLPFRIIVAGAAPVAAAAAAVVA